MITELRKIRALLSQPGAWMQDGLAADDDGRDVKPDADTAVCWCIRGAIVRTVPDIWERTEIDRHLRRVLSDHPRFGLVCDVIKFNDSRGRTQEDVLELLDLAIKRADVMECGQ